MHVKQTILQGSLGSFLIAAPPHWPNRSTKCNYCATCMLPEIVRNCCAILWIAPKCRDRFRENLCTISWLTQCHLLVKHRNRAQGSDSLTARSLRRNAREPAGTCVFNRNRSKKDLSFPHSLFGWLLETIKSYFSLLLHAAPKLSEASTNSSQCTCFKGELRFQIVINFKEWLANVMQEHLSAFTYHSVHVWVYM